MRRGNKLSVALCLGLSVLVTFSMRPAFAQEQIKPKVLLIFDTSGSMGGSTGDGPPSCGGTDERINHAKCAIQQVMDAHADIQFSMGRFRPDEPAGAPSCSNCQENGFSCNACNEGNGDGCTAEMKSADRLQVLVPFSADSNDDIREWVDFDCGQVACSLDPNDEPEIDAPGGQFTPLGGVLRGALRYFQGADPNIANVNIDDLGTIYNDPNVASPMNATEDFVDGNQCRPYVTILLTDGAETCEIFDVQPEDLPIAGVADEFDDTLGAAADLLSFTADGQTYRVDMKPIGFGLSRGNTQIEQMARAGGNPGDGAIGDGDPNATDSHEGFYANSEQELIAAFNQIIADSILVEICDGLDNDCDGNVDEGFQLFCDVDNVLGGGSTSVPTPGICSPPLDDCDGNDDNCSLGTDDEGVNACGTCDPLPTEECNLSDDDCDSFVDEVDGSGVDGGLCGDCTPVGDEICNGEDEDCDGTIDEDITVSCGTDIGECTSGTQTCIVDSFGEFGACNDVGPTTEICDGLDNDCNGVVDGFVEQCNEIAGNDPPFDGPCQPGFRVCEVPAVPGMGNAFGPCQGEIGPSAESCDLVDNDCDADVDEDTGGADCSSTCGVGTTECVMGVLECNNGGMTGTDEVCNGLDDDCDNVIDENVPDPVPNTCDEGGTLCVPGILQCVGGEFICTGGEAPGIEVCDCTDNDCDDNVDEEAGGALCPSGSDCVDCQCAFPCASDEFPCPSGFLCNDDNYCVTDPCFNVTCTPNGAGNATTCVDGECVETCTTVSCSPGTACRPSDGTCVFDDCRGFPEICDEDEFCVIDECVSDPCGNVDCPAEDEYCLEGECVRSCGQITCPEGDICVLGECQADPCGGRCEYGETCSPEGQCQDDPCTTVCQEGQACDPATGDCVQDPCLGVDCPGNEVCSFGTCYPPSYGDAGPPRDFDYVSAGGGGDGGCSAAGGAGAMGGLMLLLMLGWARRREEEL